MSWQRALLIVWVLVSAVWVSALTGYASVIWYTAPGQRLPIRETVAIALGGPLSLLVIGGAIARAVVRSRLD